MSQDSLRITALEVSNIMRVVAVAIKPNGNVVEITGKNRMGKTSILESLWMAIGGEGAIPSQPIREGAEEASIVVEIGDSAGMKLRVTRTFERRDDKPYTTKLRVQNADGANFQKPQTILNALIGSLSFDPLGFMGFDPPKQVKTLRALVPGVDFEAADAANTSAYQQRQVINRCASELRAQAKAIMLPESLPAAPVDEAQLLADLANAGTHNTAIERERSERERTADIADRAEAEARQKRAQADELRGEIAALEDAAVKMDKSAAYIREALNAKAPLPAPVDAEHLRLALEAARRQNTVMAKAAERRELIEKAELAEAESEDLTNEMKDRVDTVRAAIAAAKLPVPGLSLSETEVLLNELPLNQASGAEQLRVSVGIAAALNPRLRFVRIRDGSLLDSDSWAALVALAETMDLQVFVETVQSTRPTAVVIEDGQVKHPALQAAE